MTKRTTKAESAHQAEQELRKRYRKLFDDIDAGEVNWAVVRRTLLAEEGVELLGTRTRRRIREEYLPGKGLRTRRVRATERLDLIRYVRPGGPRRPSYWVIEWTPGWQDWGLGTLAEARIQFETWQQQPAWLRAPVLLDESEAMLERERVAKRVK